MDKIHLVMITAPMMGHLIQPIELAKMMLQKANHLSISFLVMKSPSMDPAGTAKIESLTSSCKVDRLHFHDLPIPDISQWDIPHLGIFLARLTEFHKSNVRETISKLKGIAGIIVDMLNTPMIDVADEFGIPSYIFFNSGASCLAVMLHFQTLEDEQHKNVSDLVQNESKWVIPCFTHEVPKSVLPMFLIYKGTWSDRFLKHSRDHRRAKGIIINTFTDLESLAISYLSMEYSYGTSRVPTIYPVGPILNRSQVNEDPANESNLQLMNWLDNQPSQSVFFICFGSLGSFSLNQVKEIAVALEKTGYRFIWVLRKPPAEQGGFVGDFKDLGQALPEGFLDRTASVGKVVGWVQQMDILSHPAVGAFLSHCGWNSVVESILCGVPIATWPLHAEHQLNAFLMVKELEMAVEISLDYSQNIEDQPLVKAEVIEKGIREVMDGENEIRKKVKKLSEKSKQAIKEGGSSHVSFKNLLQVLCSPLREGCKI